MTPVKRPLELGLSFLAGALLAGIVLGLRPGPGGRDPGATDSPASPGPDATDGEVRRDREELKTLDRRLSRVLELLESRPAPQPETRAPVEAAPAPEPDRRDAAEELRLLRGLRESVDRLLERSADPRAGLQRARAERPEADWSALDPLVVLWDLDVERARKEVLLLSEVEVVRRYGTPDLTFPGREGMRWVYGQGFVPERDAYRLQVVFVLEDGVVQSFYVDRL